MPKNGVGPGKVLEGGAECEHHACRVFTLPQGEQTPSSNT